jgi:hypothetical protein
MIRLFAPKSGLVAGDNPILRNPLHRSASISPKVRKEVSRHVIGAEYHVGSWHGTASLSLPVPDGVVNELNERALHFKLTRVVFLPRPEPWQPRFIAIDSSLPNFAPTRLGHNV